MTKFPYKVKMSHFLCHKYVLGHSWTLVLSQLCYGPVVTYCMVYHSTKRVTLVRLLANESPAIYAVH